MKKKIVLLGKPGSGKGTISERLERIPQYQKLIHLSTGDVFREHLKKNTPLGLKAKRYIDRGLLVPDELVNEIAKDRLIKNDVKRNGFLLDGYPRSVLQAEYLSKITEVDLCILLEIDDDTVIKRISGRFQCDKCNWIYNKFLLPPKDEGICDNCNQLIIFQQRSDDIDVDIIRKRLKTYKQNALPVIKYYEKKEILKRFDATKSLEISDDDLIDFIEVKGLITTPY